MNILLAVKHHEIKVHQAEVLAEIVKDIPMDEPDTPTRATAAGDKRKLRGVPIQAEGVGGTIPGTDPLAEYLRNEHLKERGR